jgi:hypothetical protein
MAAQLHLQHRRGAGADRHRCPGRRRPERRGGKLPHAPRLCARVLT